MWVRVRNNYGPGPSSQQVMASTFPEGGKTTPLGATPTLPLPLDVLFQSLLLLEM